MTDIFIASMWPGVLLWIVLYTSDFLFTLFCARLYRDGVRSTIAFEGSYELTPYYQQDVDSLRVFSPRFVLALLLSSVILCLIWQLAIRGLSYPPAYLIGLGALVLLELTIHVRHLRNLFLFRAVVRGGSVTGRIEYSRPLALRMSAVELFAFSGVFLVITLVTQSWFVLGGAITCFSTGWKHLTLARQHRPDVSAA